MSRRHGVEGGSAFESSGYLKSYLRELVTTGSSEFSENPCFVSGFFLESALRDGWLFSFSPVPVLPAPEEKTNAGT